MILYNYSSLKKRDTKIYDVGGYKMAGGFSVEFLKVTGPVALIIIAIGFVLSLVFGISFFNPFDETFQLWYTLTFLVVGIAVGCGMWYIQFAGYRLYQYLLAYIKPKKVYSNDFRLREYKFSNIKIKGMFKSLF